VIEREVRATEGLSIEEEYFFVVVFALCVGEDEIISTSTSISRGMSENQIIACGGGAGVVVSVDSCGCSSGNFGGVYCGLDGGGVGGTLE